MQNNHYRTWWHSWPLHLYFTHLFYQNLNKTKTSCLTKQQQKQSSHFVENVDEEVLNNLPFLQMSLVEPVEQVTETRDHSLSRSFIMRDAYQCALKFSGPNNLKCNFHLSAFYNFLRPDKKAHCTAVLQSVLIAFQQLLRFGPYGFLWVLCWEWSLIYPTYMLKF